MKNSGEMAFKKWLRRGIGRGNGYSRMWRVRGVREGRKGGDLSRGEKEGRDSCRLRQSAESEPETETED